MFKTSITKFLLASLAVLMTGLFVAAFILAVQAWENYSLAGRIASLTDTDRALFDALIVARAQVPQDSTALIAQDDPKPVIEASRKAASTMMATALRALHESDIDSREAFASRIASTWSVVERLQGLIDEQAARLRSTRDLREITPWRNAIHATTDTLNSASSALSNEVRIADPFIAEMVQIRRSAWTIRDRYGLQCSLLRPNVEINLPPSREQLRIWYGDRAVYLTSWQTLDEFLTRPGASTEIRDRVAAAKRGTATAQTRVDEIVASLNGTGHPAVSGAEWTQLCDGPFRSILDIAQAAQNEANARAEALRASSFKVLMIASFDLASVIGFGAFAVVGIQRRLARPMKLLTNTIARLSRREYDEPVPATGSDDELGAMARALEVLRVSAREAERLQLEMSRFTADASHQMRTPLTILRTHISVLATLLADDRDAQSSLKDIEEAAERLQRLLIQLLKLARADADHPANAEFSAVDLHDLVQDVAAAYVPQAMTAQIELHFEAAQGLYSIPSNAVLLKEIIGNLIDNAIRYNASGGVVVVRLYGARDGRIVVEVEDDGPGIPTSEREKVFTRFYRLNRDQGKVGSGLGLAIVRSLAARLNADVDMQNGADNRGLRVSVWFA